MFRSAEGSLSIIADPPGDILLRSTGRDPLKRQSDLLVREFPQEGTVLPTKNLRVQAMSKPSQ
jgi:hypothetical protein